MRRMGRMRRDGGRKIIVGDGLRTRRERSVALRAVLRERGWDRAAVQAALIGDAPALRVEIEVSDYRMVDSFEAGAVLADVV